MAEMGIDVTLSLGKYVLRMFETAMMIGDLRCSATSVHGALSATAAQGAT